MPLVLKNFLSGIPLFSYHSFNSSYVGFSSMIGRSSKKILCSSSHFRAFWQVLHLWYTKTNLMISPICQILSLCKQLPLLFYDIPLPWYCQRAFFVTFCRICPFYFFRTTLVFYVWICYNMLQLFNLLLTTISILAECILQTNPSYIKEVSRHGLW